MAEVTMEQCLGITTSHVQEVAEGLYAQKQAYAALQAFQADAAHHGFQLEACSGFRSFERQAFLFGRKYSGQRPILDRNEKPLARLPPEPLKRLEAILLFSAMPGFSRHHFGSDFDVYAPNCLPHGQNLQLTYHEYEDGAYFHEFGLYLKENLQRFDFSHPYEGMGLVGPEPWHLSHMPSAQPFLQAYDVEQALRYVEQRCDLDFAPYVRAVMTPERIEAMLQLSKS